MEKNKKFVQLSRADYLKLTKNQKKKYNKKLAAIRKKNLSFLPIAVNSSQPPKGGARLPIKKGSSVQYQQKKKGYEEAPKSLNITQVIAEFCPTAFEFASLGIMSVLASKKTDIDDSIYGSYFAWQTDFYKILFGATPEIKNKIKYVSALFNDLAPKTISTRTTAYKFSWKDFGPVAPSKVLTLRGNNYYFYKPNGSDPIVSPELCVPMNISGLDQAIAMYNGSLDILSGEKDALQVCAVDKVNTNLHDASAFAASSVYVGAGSCSSSGPYASGELEMPATSIPILAQFCEFLDPSDRVARFLRPSAGDPCMAFTLPYIPSFDLANYKTVHPPKVKFIDFAEVWVIYATWLAESISKALVSRFIDPSLITIIPLASAIGGLLQTIRDYFMASQSCTQFLTYDENGNLFEPFRMGSNCVPKIGQGMLLPFPLAENLRYLHAQVFQNKGETNFNSKNCVVYLPCFGLNTQSTTWYNPSFTNLEGAQIPLFDDTDGLQTTINWIDGTNGNDVFNMNSKYFLSSITILNNLVSKLSTVEGCVTYLAGTPSMSLLPYTRFYNSTELDLEELKKYPKWMPMPSGYERRVVKRTNSKKEIKDEYEIVSLHSSGTEHLTTEVPFRINCLFPIKQEIYTILQYFILPIIVSKNAGEEYSQKLDPNKFMTVYSEYHSVAFAPSGQEFVSPLSIQTILENNGRLMAPGVAQGNGATEMARAIEALNAYGKGGFLADFFSTLGSVASSIGI